MYSVVEGDRGDGNPGIMGVGSLQQVGEDRAEDRIPKGAGAERNRK